MPALITHYLFGTEILEINKQFASTKDEYDAFRWGMQGPDIFFFVLKRLSGEYKLNKMGIEMHNKYIAQPIEAMIKYLSTCEGAEYGIVYNYIGGYLCHYALDRNMHPYVYYAVDTMCGEDKTPVRQSYYHRVIETALDIIFLREKQEKTVYEYGIKKIIEKNYISQDIIAKMYRSVFNDVFGIDIEENFIKKAFSGYRFVISFLFSPFGVKRAIVRMAEFFIGMKYKLISSLSHTLMEDDKYDYSNSCKALWINSIDGTECDLSAFEIMDNAKKDVNNMFSKLDSLIKGEIAADSITQGITFDGKRINGTDNSELMENEA